jgi:hypothetical protein
VVQQLDLGHVLDPECVTRANHQEPSIGPKDASDPPRTCVLPCMAHLELARRVNDFQQFLIESQILASRDVANIRGMARSIFTSWHPFQG